MVIIPNTIRTICSNGCKTHTLHKVNQYRKQQSRKMAQGQRRYKIKQKSTGQTKPIFRKKVKVNKKLVINLECQDCGKKKQRVLGRSNLLIIRQKFKK